jgi:glutamate-ammonia-ligase adenylyltransferase
MGANARVVAIAQACDAARYDELLAELLEVGEPAASLGAAISTVFPALYGLVRARRDALGAIARDGRERARGRSELVRRLRAACGIVAGEPMPELAVVRRGLRVGAAIERLRIAAREIDPRIDVDATAREWSDLADAELEVALEEARASIESRDGVVRTAAGARNGFVVIGLGKLGGLELNAGSDIDLMFVHEADEAGSDGPTPFDAFTRVARRLVATIDEHDDDGFVARVDLRLRPEGGSGPLTNSIASSIGYYESFGRAWERAALLRARGVAGDLRVAEALLAELSPFVFRKRVEPRIAIDMADMVARARAELSADPARDLKLGPGGIREAEFFVQTLQLVWGGRDPSVRSANTLAGLRRLRARGYVTEREARDISDGLLLLRRIEHHVQLGTGVQTHLLPADGRELARLARGLGFRGAPELEAALTKARARVHERFGALSPTRPRSERDDQALRWLAALDRPLDRSLGKVTSDGADRAPVDAEPTELGAAIAALARRPDAPLGARMRERHPAFAETLVRAILEAADPEQAATLVRSFFERLPSPSVEAYVRALGGDEAQGKAGQGEHRALMRMVGLCGTSSYLGGSLVGRPELADRLLFSSGSTSAEPAESVHGIDEELARLSAEEADDPEAFVGALRRAKAGRELELGLLDLAGEIDARAVGAALAATADATLERTVEFCAKELARRRGWSRVPGGLALLGLGKLGGSELGYGADLDVLFVYDAAAIEAVGLDPLDAPEIYAKLAARVMLLLSAPHHAGAGYELDARLRPSGAQGALVVSREAFARYHLEPDAPGPHAAPWESQALTRLRRCAGDRALGEAVTAIAERAAYEVGPFARGVDAAQAFIATMREQRERLEREVARERPGRFDPKLGRGGLLDVEFVAQLLAMREGRTRTDVRKRGTLDALAALESVGALAPNEASALRDGYRFLRRLEQRVRVIHGGRAALIEAGAPGLAVLARSLGYRDRLIGRAGEQLLERYREITDEVRATFDAVTGRC